ncbi:MAG: metallophosphoesterase [Clostridiales bacterium]|nr:metallophosphoesterase [Clostridiales bacterium]
MKILVISDTHGDLTKAKNVIKKHSDSDLIVHCGDNIKDAKELKNFTSIGIIMVKGNCDGSQSQDDFIKYKTPYGTILIVHGHQYGIDNSYLNLAYKAKEENCVAVLAGHTHVSYLGEHSGIKILNPGSLSRPRDGKPGSYGIIKVSADEFSYSIEYYNDKKTKKVTGGFLRGMINHSDRY